MSHRSSYDDGRRGGREDDHRRGAARGRPGSRFGYGAEGRSWDDNGGGGYERDAYDRDFGGERGPRGGSQHGRRQDFGEPGYREAPFGASRERGYRDAGFGAGYQSEANYEQYLGRPRQHDHGHPSDNDPSYGQTGYGRPFGGDYGQYGQGGFGSGGGYGASRTGGGAGEAGHSPYGYQQGGYAPGAQIWQGQGQDVAGGRQFHHDYEPDYLHWRDQQMRNLDEDYHAWRDERRQKFSSDFDEWRSRRQASGQGTSTLSQGGPNTTPTLGKVAGGETDIDKKKN